MGSDLLSSKKKSKNYPTKWKQTKRKALFRNFPGGWVLYIFFRLVFLKTVLLCLITWASVEYTAFFMPHIFSINHPPPPALLMRCPLANKGCLLQEPYNLECEDGENQKGVLSLREVTWPAQDSWYWSLIWFLSQLVLPTKLCCFDVAGRINVRSKRWHYALLLDVSFRLCVVLLLKHHLHMSILL